MASMSMMSLASGLDAPKTGHPIHLALYPQCGICVQDITVAQDIRVVYRAYPNTFNCTSEFMFPSHDQEIVMLRSEGIEFCRNVSCPRCAASPETVPVHEDCYDVFMKECVIKDENAAHIRLWAVAAWRKPWMEGQPLFLQYPMSVDASVVDAVARRLGLPQLMELPLEIVGMIRDYSKHSLFWQCVSAVALAIFISKTKDEPRGLQKVLLREVLAWERGGTITMGSPESLPPIIKITFDFDGISSISRHSHRPEYSGVRSIQNAYIVAPEDDETFREVEVHIIHGRSRLSLRNDTPVPHIWNTPAPPLLPSCHMAMARDFAFISWPRFTAVDPNEIRGMTFFLHQGSLCNIHIHYPRGPPAIQTFHKTVFEFRSHVVWIYLPISRGDRLTGLGMRRDPSRPFNLLAQTEKSGDIIIGPHQAAFRDECFGNTAPLTFIHQQMKQGTTSQHLSVLGTYSAVAPVKNFQEDFPQDRYERSPLCLSNQFETVYFSWASLEHVASLVFIYDRVTESTDGILLHYLNGGCRALGEYRLDGLNKVRKVDKPTMVCIRTKSVAAMFADRFVHYAFTEFHNKAEHTHPAGEEWVCKPMAGCLKFWRTSNSSFLAVRPM